MSERLLELWDNLNDRYWRLDHPEVMAVLLGIITGCVGLLFAWLQTRIIKPAGGPE